MRVHCLRRHLIPTTSLSKSFCNLTDRKNVPIDGLDGWPSDDRRRQVTPCLVVRTRILQLSRYDHSKLDGYVALCYNLVLVGQEDL